MDFGKQEFIEIGVLKGVPQNVSYLAPAPNTPVELTEITVCWDESNKFTKITNFQTEEYYEDYFMTTTWSESMQQLQSSQVVRLRELARDRKFDGKSLIEVGCGDGSFLNHATSKFDIVVGIEPSKPFADYARNRGFNILNGYVTSETPLTEDKFDFFVSRQVFEHLPNPLDCLLGIRKMLNPGAIGLIEVPNGFRALHLGRFFEFFPDHINYYSVNSLVSLADSAGFNVISCNESFNGDYLELWIQLVPNVNTLGMNLVELEQKTLDSISSWVIGEPDGTRFIFGCGAKMLSIVSKNPSLFHKHFKYAVDSDPNKIGKFIPNTGIEILAITDERLMECTTSLITALSYIDEIKNLILSCIPTCTSIVSLNQNGEVVVV